VKRHRFVKLTGADQSVNWALEAKARSLAGIKGYITNLDPAIAGSDLVIGAYHRLFQIEKSFWMSAHDLQARPIYHHKRESIYAHLTVVFAAPAVSKFIEAETGWSIARFVRTARRYRTIEIQAGKHTITASDPLPEDQPTPSWTAQYSIMAVTIRVPLGAVGHVLSILERSVED